MSYFAVSLYFFFFLFFFYFCTAFSLSLTKYHHILLYFNSKFFISLSLFLTHIHTHTHTYARTQPCLISSSDRFNRARKSMSRKVFGYMSASFNMYTFIEKFIFIKDDESKVNSCQIFSVLDRLAERVEAKEICWVRQIVRIYRR